MKIKVIGIEQAATLMEAATGSTIVKVDGIFATQLTGAEECILVQGVGESFLHIS